MEASASYTGKDRRPVQRPSHPWFLQRNAIRAVSKLDAMGKPRFGENGREDIHTVNDAQLGGGAQFRQQVLAVMALIEKGFTGEQLRILSAMSLDYMYMIPTLQERKISLEGIYTWDQIEAAITPEHMAKVLLMQRLGMHPKLILIPPIGRKKLIPAITDHVEMNEDEFNDDTLFNGGIEEPAQLQWEVAIVDIDYRGETPSCIQTTGTIQECAAAWAAEIKKNGLDVVSNARIQAATEMKGLAVCKEMRATRNVILNAENAKPEGKIAYSNVRIDNSRDPIRLLQFKTVPSNQPFTNDFQVCAMVKVAMH